MLTIFAFGFSGCQKEAVDQINPQGEELTPLALSIENFTKTVLYKQAATNALARTNTSPGIYTYDSAEFWLENTYNYYYARVDDLSPQEHGKFEFNYNSINPEELTGDEVAEIYYQIQDSLDLFMSTVSYSSKSLGLFDLTLEQISNGGNDLFIKVRFSIITDDALNGSIAQPGPVDGTTSDAYALLWEPCQKAAFLSPHSIVLDINPYFFGRAILDLPNAAVVAGTKDCNLPGATIALRTKGIVNYRSQYPSPLPNAYLHTNISFVHYNGFNVTNLYPDHYYLANGYNSGILQADQLIMRASSANSGISPNFNTVFYSQYLNVPMMNFFLQFIPGKILNSLQPNGSLVDFQIDRVKFNTDPTLYDVADVYTIYSGAATTTVLPQQAQLGSYPF